MDFFFFKDAVGTLDLAVEETCGTGGTQVRGEERGCSARRTAH